MFYFFGKGKCTEVFQGIRDITPEVYCLIGKHLFSSVSTRTRFTEVLLRCIPCINELRHLAFDCAHLHCYCVGLGTKYNWHRVKLYIEQRCCVFMFRLI